MSERKSRLPKYENIAIIVIIAVSAAGIFVLNYLFPQTGDDMTYSVFKDMPLSRLFSVAAHQGSGRLLGNFFGYLIKYKPFIVFEKTAVWMGIILSVMLLVGSKSVIVNAVIAFVMIFPCDSLFSEVYAWNAGFQNYAFPVFIILFDVLLIKKSSEIKGKIPKILLTAIIFVSAFAGQFFSENSSFFAVCLALSLIIVAAKTGKCRLYASVAYFVSTLAGFAAMLLYPHILGTSEKISFYRSYAASFSDFLSLALKNYRTIAKDFSSYAVLWIILSLSFVIFIRRMLKSSECGAAIKAVLRLCEAVICVYPVFSSCYALSVKTPIAYPRYYFNAAFCVSLALYAAAILTVSVIILIRKDTPEDAKKSSFPVILGAVSVLPLFAVSPIGSRTFYIPFVCFFISGISGLRAYFEKIKTNAVTSAASAAAVMCVLAVLGMAETDNRFCSNVRLNHLESAIDSGADKVTLPLLPHQNFLHEDSNSKTWDYYAEHKYGCEIEIEFEDWDSWYSEYYRKK